jgi:hypothetical protein
MASVNYRARAAWLAVVTVFSLAVAVVWLALAIWWPGRGNRWIEMTCGAVALLNSIGHGAMAVSYFRRSRSQ